MSLLRLIGLLPSLTIGVLLWQIHDSDMITGHPLEKIINGSAHHTLHHMYFNVNYGQVCSSIPIILFQFLIRLVFSISHGQTATTIHTVNLRAP